MVDDGTHYSFRGKYNDGVQKRKNARIPVEIKGTFKYMDSENTINDNCLLTNLSTGGLAFKTSCVLLVSDVVNITFMLENKIIIECCKITTIRGGEIGAKFVSPRKENIEEIQKYIYKKLFV